MDQVRARFETLKETIRRYQPGADFARLDAAFVFADCEHGDQMRKDGSPYITHPLAVAEIVADLELDTDSIIAALLHDCIEDTEATHEEIAKKFGTTVAELVEGVTKLTRVQYISKEEEQMENLRKMLMAMSRDIRVILIKICDRLHNMRTLQFQSPDKQREIALETMEIYAPIAHRLGMQRVKWDLEDLSLQYLDPIGYREITDELASRSLAHEEFLLAIQKKIQERLAEDEIRATVYGRVKHIYSIYRKMYGQNKTMDEVFDLYAFRVIVDELTECYNVLGCIHDLFKPVLGRFKDYIGTPKPNLYQSLHTTVIGREGIPFEVQIRTWDMHQTAEYGVAAHWKYKQGIQTRETGTEGHFEWIRRLLESQQDADAEEFVHSMKVDLFSDEVFVFSPKGDVISLPAGSTPIDFAFHIHSAVGSSMTAAKANGRIVPLDYQLRSGDVVEILTSKSAHGPSRDWIKIVRSNEARNKIRQWFKRERRDENIATGRSSFESELRRVSISMAQLTAEDTLPHLLKKFRFASLDELYAAIGYGGMTAQKAVSRIRDELVRLGRMQQKPKNPAFEGTIMPGGQAAQQSKRPTRTESGIAVEGMGGVAVKFSKCCTPVPGDEVVGFITRGYGVSVHRTDCPNAAADRRKPEENGRWVSVSWVESESSGYKTSLEIMAKDRDGLALDIATILSTVKVRVSAMAARGQPDGYAIVTVVLEVRDKDELNAVMNKLNQISGVYLVRRVSG